MVKNVSLSNDIDLIKELEELKLKQKILVNSLRNKNKNSLDIQIFNINKKVEFLVKIFEEVKKHDKENKTEEVTLKFLDIKIDSLLEFNKKKFEEIEKRFSNFEIIINELKTENLEKNKQMNNLKIPKPEFVVNNIEKSKNKLLDNLEIKNKKKWF